nr:MAG TPA: hypothetical protein [Caudoviricetes sp.]
MIFNHFQLAIISNSIIVVSHQYQLVNISYDTTSLIYR